MINHGFGYKTDMLIVASIIVGKVKKVKGDLIGFVGNTGQSSGPHLHYEVFKNNRQINPSIFSLTT